MRTITVSVVLIFALFAVFGCDGSDDFVDKQIDTLKLFHLLFQRNSQVKLYHAVFGEFQFDVENYDDPNVYTDFSEQYLGYESVDEFTCMNNDQLSAAISLYNFFMSAKNYNTFKKTANWASYNVNPQMCIYALTIAIAHREDLKGVIVPAMYEINPFYFYDSKVIQQAVNYQMRGYEGIKDNGEVYEIIIQANYTGNHQILNKESILSYFTEDVGISDTFYRLHTEFPFWLENSDTELRMSVMISYLHNTLARYYMERLSNGLGAVEDFSWTEHLEHGYNPHLRYRSGAAFPDRSNYFKLYNKQTYREIDQLKSLESVLQYHWKDMSTKDYNKLVLKYVGMTKRLLGLVLNTEEPSVFQHYETVLRDPVIYQLMKRLFSLLPYGEPHQQNDLSYEGVTIEHADTEKLITFFENFYSDITNAIETPFHSDYKPVPGSLAEFGRTAQLNGKDLVIKARQSRLTHLPFTYKLNVNSNKAQSGILRVFLGPKFNEFGQEVSLEQNRENFYQLDVTHIDLGEGRNVIVRSCQDFFFYAPEQTSYYDLYKAAMHADNKEDKLTTKARTGFPWRLMLPKGRKEGMAVQFFFHISTDSVMQNDSIRQLRYPLDRPINNKFWYTTNMYYYDTMIYHK